MNTLTLTEVCRRVSLPEHAVIEIVEVGGCKVGVEGCLVRIKLVEKNNVRVFRVRTYVEVMTAFFLFH